MVLKRSYSVYLRTGGAAGAGGAAAGGAGAAGGGAGGRAWARSGGAQPEQEENARRQLASGRKADVRSNAHRESKRALAACTAATVLMRNPSSASRSAAERLLRSGACSWASASRLRCDEFCSSPGELSEARLRLYG